MGQVPAKYFMPPAPQGASAASNVVNPVQAPPINPQTPLLPSGFTDPGATVIGKASPAGLGSGGGALSRLPRPPSLPGSPILNQRIPML